jgi:rfaE bifunctional protein nucleotidyltransferase chain/domain
MAEHPWQLPSSVNDVLLAARKAGQKIVLATGVFDLLHEEHKQFLQAAKAQGDVLVVGLESDVRVRQMKGEGRPINPQQQRVENLAAWGIADAIFVLPEQFAGDEDHLALLKTIQPAILAVSAHTLHQDKKAKLMSEVGGKLVVVRPHNENISSSLLLKQQQTS